LFPQQHTSILSLFNYPFMTAMTQPMLASTLARAKKKDHLIRICQTPSM
jgi:hypothetical protein